MGCLDGQLLFAFPHSTNAKNEHEFSCVKSLWTGARLCSAGADARARPGGARAPPRARRRVRVAMAAPAWWMGTASPEARLLAPYSISTGIPQGGDAELQGYVHSIRTQGVRAPPTLAALDLTLVILQTHRLICFVRVVVLLY